MSSPDSSALGALGTSSSPDRRAVNDFHRNSDLNSRPEAQHHDLGNGANQSAFGNHTHDGQRGLPLLDGVTFTGSRTNNTADIINQICNALANIGAVNNTGA